MVSLMIISCNFSKYDPKNGKNDRGPRKFKKMHNWGPYFVRHELERKIN